MSLFTTAASTAAAAATESDSGWIVGVVVLVVVGLLIAAVALLGSRRKAATYRESLAADRADRERDRLAATQQADSLRKRQPARRRTSSACDPSRASRIGSPARNQIAPAPPR